MIENDKSKTDTVLDVLKSLYLHESTSAGQAVTMLTQDSDQASRWILFRHLQKQGYKKESSNGKIKLDDVAMEQINQDASKVAARSFIDYREQLPEELRALSTYGFWRFVTFGMKINSTLYRLAMHNPVRTAGYSMSYSAVADVMGDLHSSNPFNSNLLVGMEFGTELNPVGSEMFIPMYY